MNKITLLTAIFCLAVSASSSRSEPVVVTPDSVVKLTLAHSPALKSRDEAVLAAAARRRQADAGLKPQLDTRAQALHFEGLENQALGPVTIPVIENQYSASIGITQPLYTGGRVTRQKQGARLNEESSRHARSASSSDLTLQTLTTYWQWSKILAQKETYQAAITRMNALATDTRNLEKAGMATDNDRLAVEVSLDQAQLQFDEAQQQADLCRIELERLAGREFTPDEIPQKPVLAPADLLPPPLDNARTQALTNRQELIALRLAACASDTLVAAVRADGRPQLALIARYEQGNPNQRDFPPDDKWRDDAVIGATLSWNLFDGGLTRARTAEARTRASSDALQLQAMEESVVAGVRAAHLSLQHALARRQTALHAEAGASRNLEVATALWKNGTARHSDVLDAQSKLTATTAQRLAVEADIILAHAALRHATGILGE